MTKDNSSSPRSEAIAKIEAMFSEGRQCRQCGKEYRYEVDEFYSPEDWLKELEIMREKKPELLEKFLGMESYCDECVTRFANSKREQADRERVAKLRRDAYGLGCLPEVAAHCTFAKSNRETEGRNVAYWLMAREWERHSKNVWITGDPGSGKTYLARCVANHFIDLGMTAHEVSGLELANHVRSFQWLENVKPMIRARLLIIDDIDKANWSKEQLDILWHVLDKRLGGGKRLIVTANVMPEHFRESLERNRPENKAVASPIFRRMLPENGETVRWVLK